MCRAHSIPCTKALLTSLGYLHTFTIPVFGIYTLARYQRTGLGQTPRHMYCMDECVEVDPAERSLLWPGGERKSLIGPMVSTRLDKA